MFKASSLKSIGQEVGKKLAQQVAEHLPKTAPAAAAASEVHLPKTAPAVPITINNKRIEADPSWTVQEAARQAGIFVPTVCNHPRLKPAGRCKVCTVHVTEGDTSMYKLACCTKVTPEMKVTTDSLAVRSKADLALKTLLKPLGKTATVPRGLTDEMDKLLEWENTSLVDTSSPSLVRDNNLCVGCSRCVRACSDLQGMNILEASMEDQGYQIATTVCGNHIQDTDCILCGQCSVFCPTGAIVEKDDVPRVIAALESKKILMLQTAPATRVALAECFGSAPGTVATAKLVGAAKAAGFSYVFDTNFAADLTIMEEGTEFLNRLEKGGPFPMFTSCCPAWINMAEKRYPEYLKNLSTCKSPQMMMGAVLKKYWADRMGIDASRIFSVSIMPCTAKKDELSRPQLQHDGIADVDVALTTREFARLLQQRGISDFDQVPELPYDDPLGQTSGAAALFGVTGGVMEAALRTAFEAKTGQTLPKLEFHACRGLDGIKEATVDVGGAKLSIAIASGGKNIQKVMDWVKNGQKEYHFVEMMACPSGCIGGGGQPRSDDPEVLTRRMESIYQLDHNSLIRKSHENPAVKRIYTDFFEKPNSRLSHQLLHTHYTNRMKPKVEASATGPVKKEASAGSGLLILFGSQSGTAAGAARQLKESYERKKPGSKVRCMAMNNYSFADLPKESHIIMVCSTYGEGVFPDNAAEFWENLKDPNLSDDWLKNVHFSICGLGSSAYTYFNKAAKDLDRRFEELGGTRLCPSVFAGERATEKYAATFDPWSEALMATLGGGADSINEPQAPQYQLTLALDSKRRNLRPCPPGYHFIHLAEKYRLTAPTDYPRPADYLDLDLSGSGMAYKAGAHLAILPRNRPEQVTAFLDFAGLDGEKLVSIHVVNAEPSEIPPVLTVRELFEQYIDLNAPVSRKFMLQLAVFAEEKEAAELRKVCAKPKSVEFETFLQEYTHEDVLRMFPSALPPIESLISMVPVIKSRKYSIASSSSLYPDNAHLAVVLWQGLLPSGKKRIGLCSDYLLSLDPSKRPVLAAAMHEGILAAPEDPATPCMFLALGTGIASVRAFLQEREGMKKAGMTLGKCHLWFGVRHRKHDHFFRDMFQQYVEQGILTAVHTSFSHDDPAVFETVPMLMGRNPAAVWDVMRHKDACVYYCGPAMGIPKTCTDAMTRACVTAGGMSEAQAIDYFKAMVTEERWRMECF